MTQTRVSYKSNLKYWTLKYNPLTSFLLRSMTSYRGRNLEWLIFTATTGRSGTMSLARIFATVDGCRAYHEPYPWMNGNELINPETNDDPYLKFLYQTVKSVNIRRYAFGARYYFEANHIFIKNFYRYVIEDFPGKIKVVHLFRDPVKVANSIYSLGHHPGSFEGNNWYLDYRGANNKIKIADILDHDGKYNHVFYRCLWYWYEIEARIKVFREQYPEVTVVDLRTEDMDDLDKIENMFMRMQLPYNIEKIAKVIGVRENQMTSEKVVPPLNMEKAENMHQEFLGLLKQLGYGENVVKK